MKNKATTIRKIVRQINNPDDEGGLWLPNIQRPFVWKEDQICRLFDSILRKYPISTLLVWKTKSKIRRRKFIDLFDPKAGLSAYFVPEDAGSKMLVLDGQQRLQALFIGLTGSYEKRELYFDILSGEATLPDDIKYKFAFKQPAEAKFPWVRFKDLVMWTDSRKKLEKDLVKLAPDSLSPEKEEKIAEHVDLVMSCFADQEFVTYQELDSIDNPALYTEDDVVEIFIRANSGGTKLEKSDLLFSLLSSSWDESDEAMEELLASLNQHGFKFDRDFVLKTALILLDQGARYEVRKFRTPAIREKLVAEWKDISESLEAVVDFVRNKTYIQTDNALPSNLALMPLVFVRHRYPEAWKSATNIDQYLLRGLLANAFSGNADTLLDALIKRIRELEHFDVQELFGVIRSQNRSLELTEDRFWQMGYGHDALHLLLNLWYRDFNHVPAYDGNLPQVDHIFPQGVLKKIKTTNPNTGKKNVEQYPKATRNQLANLMLLTKDENGAGGKGDTLPDEWFPKRLAEDPGYLDRHLIPTDPALWKLDRFEEFIAARKTLIRERFKDLLAPT